MIPGRFIRIPAQILTLAAIFLTALPISAVQYEWTQLNLATSDSVTSLDFDGDGKDELLIDFGQYGVYSWDGDSPNPWTQVHSVSPESITAIDIDGSGRCKAIFDYGEFSLWLWDIDSAPVWSQIHTVSPQLVTSGDFDGDDKGEAMMSFSGYGLWLWDSDNASVWSQLHTVSPKSIASGDFDGDGKDEAIIDYNKCGIYLWDEDNPSHWSNVHTITASSIVPIEYDGDARSEAIIDFGSQYGIYIWDTNGPDLWTRLNNVTSVCMASPDFDGDGKDEAAIDFADGFEIYIWNAEDDPVWTWLNSAASKSITASDLDGDKRDEIVIDFGQYGVWFASNTSAYISGISSACTPDGYAININGSRFGASQGSSKIELDGVSISPVRSWSENSLTLIIPLGSITPGEKTLSVVTQTGRSNNAKITLPAPLASPLNLTVQNVQAAKVNIAWQDASSDEEGFKIESSDDFGATFQLIGGVGQGVTAFSPAPLGSQKTYIFRVYAYAGARCSPYSNVTQARTTALASPALNAVTSPTSNESLSLSGAKDAHTSIWINGVERVPIDALQSFTVSILLNEGLNHISVSEKDTLGVEGPAVTCGIFLDTTPPAIPAVTDDGATTNIQDSLHALWNSVDPDTGIAEYLYAIGTAPYLDNVLGWTSAGASTSVTVPGLSLVPGSTYYINVKAKNTAGLWSVVGSSDGIMLIQTSPVIAAIVPVDGSVVDSGDAVSFNITASDPEDDAIKYKIEVDGTVVSDWNEEPVFEWQTLPLPLGVKEVTVSVKDVWGNTSIKNFSLYITRKAPAIPQVQS